MTLRSILIKSLPTFRFLAGVACGKICLAIDNNPVNALVISAFVPIALYWFTEEYEK